MSVTFSNSGVCPTLDGKTFSLSYTGGGVWQNTNVGNISGGILCPSMIFSLQITCLSTLPHGCGQLQLTGSASDPGTCGCILGAATGIPGYLPDAGCNCSPLSLTYSNVKMAKQTVPLTCNTPCNGTWTVTVTG